MKHSSVKETAKLGRPIILREIKLLVKQSSLKKTAKLDRPTILGEKEMSNLMVTAKLGRSTVPE